jgi:hypothetical protein
MKKILLILLLINFATGTALCQFSVDELITLASMQSKNIDHFMKKKGYVISDKESNSGTMGKSFIEKPSPNKKWDEPKRSINITVKEDSKNFTLNTPVLNEYLAGKQRLIKSGFFYDTLKNINKEQTVLFQKGNITIRTSTHVMDGMTQYSFDLKEKIISPKLEYAEDLLQFDSNELLASFFGKQNVKKDIYYLSEKEVRTCSVIFSGTQRQVVFVWGDEVYLNNLSYIIVTNKLPTAGGKDANPLAGNNQWKLKSGIHPGMPLTDMLEINEKDFTIYGKESDMAFIVKPGNNGKIDFKKIAIMLSCPDCYYNKIFNRKEVSALAVAKANLPMRVLDVVIYASD